MEMPTENVDKENREFLYKNVLNSDQKIKCRSEVDFA